MITVLVIDGALCLPGYSDGRMMHAVFKQLFPGLAGVALHCGTGW